MAAKRKRQGASETPATGPSEIGAGTIEAGGGVTALAKHPFDPALAGSIMFYSMSCCARFETIGEDKAEAAAHFCAQWSLEYPLWARGKDGAFPKREIPGFESRSSVFAVAVMTSYLVWSIRKQSNGLQGLQSLFKTNPMLAAANDGYEMWQQQRAAQQTKEGAR